MENENVEVVEETVVNNTTVEEKVETGVEPDKNIEEHKEEVNKTTPESTNDDNPVIEEYANKYDAMLQENEELKSKLAERDTKYAELEATIKTLQEGMAKLRKANEFASSSSSIQQNQRVGGMASAEDILIVRSKI